MNPINTSKLCINCVHFKKVSANLEKGLCKRYVETSVVTGKESYKYAIVCRTNRGLCGYDAKEFEELEFK
jgi:hypothetical protein